jgi:hypothetical protein
VLLQLKELDGRVILVMNKNALASGNLKIGPLVDGLASAAFKPSYLVSPNTKNKRSNQSLQKSLLCISHFLFIWQCRHLVRKLLV